MVKKTKIYIKFICIMLTAVLSFEVSCYPSGIYPLNKDKLAVQSGFAPVTNPGIADGLELGAQALEGIRLFLSGKSITVVNGMLIEGYSRRNSSEGRVEFVDVRYDNDGMVRALFRVGDVKNSVYEIRYSLSDISGDRNIIDTGYLAADDIIRKGQAGKVVSARSLLDSSAIDKEGLVADLIAFEEDLLGIDLRALDNGMDVEDEWEKDLGDYEIFLLIKEGEITGYAEFDIKGDESELIYIGVKRAERYNHGGSLLLDAYFSYLGYNGVKRATIKSKNGARNFYEEYLGSVGASYYIDDGTTEFHIDNIPQMRQRYKDGDAGSGAVADTLILRDVFTEKDKVVINEINVPPDGIRLLDDMIPFSISASYLEKANSLKDIWVRAALMAEGDEENFLVYELAELVTMMLSEDEEESAAAINAFRRGMAENPSNSNICRPAAEILCHASAEKPHFSRREHLTSLERVLNNGFYEKDPYVIFYAALAIANTVHFSDKNTAIVTSGLVLSLLEVLENSMMDPEVESSTHGAVGLALIEIIKKYPELLPEDISKKLRIALERFSGKYSETSGKNPSNEFSRHVLSMAVSLTDDISGIETGTVIPDINIPIDNFIFVDDFGDFGKPLKQFEEKMVDNVRKFENVAGRAGANMIKNEVYITAEHGEWGDILPAEAGVSHFALMGAFCNNCIARQTSEIIKKTIGERNDKEVYITLPLSAIQMSHSASVDTLKYYIPDSFKYMENDSSLRSFTHPLNPEGDHMWNLPVYKDTRVLVLKDGEVVSEFINSDKDVGDPSMRTVVLNFLESEEAVEKFLAEQDDIYLKKPEKYADTMGDESTDEEYLLTRSGRLFNDAGRYVHKVSDSDKNGIDELIDKNGSDGRRELLRELDAYIHARGGLSAVPAQIRYALFKVMQDINVLRKELRSMKSVSDTSKKQLRLRMGISDKNLAFSDVAMAVFSGMVEDGEFGAFCESVQNKSPTYLPGAAEVLLVDSPGTGGDASTGLYRIASFLSLSGMKASVITPGEMSDIKGSPHIIGKRFITATIQEDLEIAKDVSKMFPGSFMVAGGQEAAISDRVLRLYSGIDCSIKRLGEEGMLDIVAGLTVKDGEITSESREHLLGTSEKLHTLSKPSVTKALTDLEFRVLFKSFNPNLIEGAVSKDSINYMLTTSHCPMDCIFCISKSFMARSVAGRQNIVRVEVDDIIERLKRIRRYLPEARKIYFSDDNFFDVRKRVGSFVDRMKAEGLDNHFSFIFSARLDSLERMPRDILEGLAEIGADFIIIGVESTIPRIVESIGKGGRVNLGMAENFTNIMKKITAAGIPHPMAFMLLFTPDETLDDSLKIMDDISRIIEEDNIGFSLSEGLSIFPGTELFNMYAEGKVDADTVEMYPDGDMNRTPIVMPADALPNDPENRRFIKRKKDKATVSSVVYNNDLEEEYDSIRRRVMAEVADDNLRYVINTNLSALYRIHINLLLISNMFLARKYRVLHMVDDLRVRRDMWLERQLSSAKEIPGEKERTIRVEAGELMRSWASEWHEEISLLSEKNIHIPERFYLDLENRKNESGLAWKLKQAMEEVLRNASQGADGMFWGVNEINLRIASAGKEVRIEIEDDGAGIPERTLDEYRAWQRGEREDALISAKGSSGKGLQTAYEHIRDMGGRMEIETSSDPASGMEKGTLVRMIFPGEIETEDHEYPGKGPSEELRMTRLNMHIDLSVIPDEEGQLEENMKTIALMISRNSKYGMDIRYILEGDRKERALEMVRYHLKRIAETSGTGIDDIMKSIGPHHEGEEVITVRLENSGAIEKDRRMGEKEYIVALKPAESGKGIPIPNYTASSVMGLSLAALRNASDMVKLDRMERKDYEELKDRVLDRFRDIYYRYGVISDPSVFSAEELEMMVSGSSSTKLYYAVYYALPPAIKVTGGIHEYHEIIRDTLIAA